MSSDSQPFNAAQKFCIYIYYAFLILGGQVCIPLSLLRMYITKSNIRRYPTLINSLLSWFIYTLPTMFLYVPTLISSEFTRIACLTPSYLGRTIIFRLYSNQHLERHPSFKVCLVQAALCYATSAE